MIGIVLFLLLEVVIVSVLYCHGGDFLMLLLMLHVVLVFEHDLVYFVVLSRVHVAAFVHMLIGVLGFSVSLTQIPILCRRRAQI
jgi:hypothetical protein